MPKIYEYLGLIFFFYANEHLPIHVHVAKDENESKIELFFEGGKLADWNVLSVKGRKPLSQKDLKEAIRFAKKYANGIADKWADFFVKNKRVKCEVIKKKI
jgi:antitoxin component YwqK of YwqJK toxin-antitoxin module